MAIADGFVCCGLAALAPPQIARVEKNSAGVTLTVPSVLGLSYTLEYKNALSDPQWLPLLPPQPGSGSPMSLTDSNAPATSRFYRVHGE
jgi:hypothetical protein